MMTTITLPQADGSLKKYLLDDTAPVLAPAQPKFNRIAYAAAHVVVDPLRQDSQWLQRPYIDWDATMAFRHHLWRQGFKIAEAMDTAQRGMGVDWATAKELIHRSLDEARTVDGADLAAGAGTDQLNPEDARSLDDVVAAYEEQMEAIESKGGRLILMASRALAAVAQGADDYIRVYDRLLTQARDKVILHWLGDVFDPALKGYWGSEDVAEAMDTVLQIIESHRDKVDGIKISLLSKEWELVLRSRLPEGVRMYTGDDFNYSELIEGQDGTYSHALLGIFDAIAPVASAALSKLAQGQIQAYRDLLEPTVPLSREIFKAPTQYYKAGVVFLAWLNGHQEHFVMAGGMQSAREISHYARVFELADQAGLLADRTLAVRRMQSLLAMHGIQ